MCACVCLYDTTLSTPDAEYLEHNIRKCRSIYMYVALKDFWKRICLNERMVCELYNCLVLSLDGNNNILSDIFHIILSFTFSDMLLALSLDIDVPVITCLNKVLSLCIDSCSMDSLPGIQCVYLSLFV